MPRPNDILTNAHSLYNRPQRLDLPLINRIYLGKVRDTRDPQKMGRIKVWVPDISGHRDDTSGWFTASYCSPFGGASFIDDGFYEDSITNNSIQDLSAVAKDRTPTNVAGQLGGRQGYGMWFPAPDVGNDVLVAFLSGDPVNCVYFGFLFPQNQNFMLPGAPSATFAQADGLPSMSGPALETDLRDPLNLNSDSPPRRPFGALAEGLVTQGLQDDMLRGQSTSGARRESPSQVFGIMTPSGHQFVLDDGDTSGNSSLIRLRTKSGAQLLIDDDSGNIYAITKDGRTWIELNDDGNVDIYGQSSVSVHAENGNINLCTSADDINIQSGGDINMRASGNLNFYAGGGTNMVTPGDFKSTAGGSLQIGASGQVTVASSASLSLSSGGKASLSGSGVAIGSGGSIGINASGTVDLNGSEVNQNMGGGLAPDPGNIDSPSLPDLYNNLPQAPVLVNGLRQKGPNSLTAIVSRLPQAEPWDRASAGSFASNKSGNEGANSSVDQSGLSTGFTGNAASITVPIKSVTPGSLGKILDMIAQYESVKGSYGSVLGGNINDNLVNMTIQQAHDYGQMIRKTTSIGKRLNSSAIGRYQFVGGTLIGAAKNCGLNPATAKFNQANQDKMALSLINNLPQRFLEGKIPPETLIRKIASQWQSWPLSPSNNVIGGSSKPALWKWDTVGSTLNKLKAGN